MDAIETVESSAPERQQQTTDKKSERPYSLMVNLPILYFVLRCQFNNAMLITNSSCENSLHTLGQPGFIIIISNGGRTCLNAFNS